MKLRCQSSSGESSVQHNRGVLAILGVYNHTAPTVPPSVLSLLLERSSCQQCHAVFLLSAASGMRSIVMTKTIMLPGCSCLWPYLSTVVAHGP